MSIKMVRRSWKDAMVDGRPLAILLFLAYRAHDKREVRVSLKAICQHTRLHEGHTHEGLEPLGITRHIAVVWPTIEGGDLTLQLCPGKDWVLRR